MWKFHYTGIEIAQREFRLGSSYVNLYINRDAQSKRWAFIRLSWRIWRRHRMIGLFMGNLNLFKHFGRGFELFTNNLTVGLLTQRHSYSRSRVHWGGSVIKPYEHVAIRLGRVCLGSFKPPKWLKRRKEAYEDAKWEAMAVDYDRMYDEQGEAR